MKTLFTSAPKRGNQAWSLLAVLTMTSVSLVYLAGVMNWSNGSAKSMQRNNSYTAAQYAAEAATEKAMATMVSDAIQYGEGYVVTRLNTSSTTYSNILPSSTDNVALTGFQYTGGTGLSNKVCINLVNASNQTVLTGTYAGLYCEGNLYEVIANAYSTSDPNKVTAAVGEQLNLGEIPIFQFAIFYEYEMEIAPGAVMTVGGPVHGNSIIYMDPGQTLTFSNTVTSSSNIVLTADPNDPGGNTTPATINFNGSPKTNVNVAKLELPIGTNNNGSGGENIYATLQVPPSGESPGSSIGTNRYYNKVDMIILISNNTTVSITSGVAVNNQATVITNWQLFLNLTNQFDNQRDGTTVQAAVLNENNLRLWSATNTTLYTALGNRNVESIFIADLRPTSNAVVTTTATNVVYTNGTVNVSTNTPTHPTAGTYNPPITTNTTVTTTTPYPGAGTYVPPVTTTNTTSTTTSTHPSTGSYTGSVTTNGSGGSKTYTYHLINGYTYNLISSYSYSAIVLNVSIPSGTNYTYLTNWTQWAEPGLVLTNGATLPPNGLTVVTPDPAYVVGNWNVSTDGSTMYTNTSSTAHTFPSSICSDAINIFSPAWNPNQSSNAIANRVAVSDTVNAAILTGYVPTVIGNYSGGVENFPRFQENWSSVPFYYNGSMVAMFYSQIATGAWPGTGTVYNPPNRFWTFDQNFTNPAKLPPLTPSVQYYSRQGWTALTPNTTSF